jgi:hypothetical protein
MKLICILIPASMSDTRLNLLRTRLERQSCKKRGILALKKSKIGRPKLPKGEAKGRIVPVRFTGDDLKAITVMAKAANQNVSEWIRSTIHASLTA